MGIKDPLLVGVTGGIGAGKSLVCKILNNLGIPIYSSDDRAKVLMVDNKKLKKTIINNFGVESYSGNQLNNQYLSALLIDTGGYKELDFNVYVLADKAVRIKRIIKRDPDRNKSDIIKIMDNQIEDSKAAKYCDKVINNDGELLLLPQVLELHDQILKISQN